MNKKVLMLAIAVIGMATFFNSCTETKKSDLFSMITKSDEGDFRGVNLNCKFDDVKNAEDKTSLKDERENESLEYDYKIDEDNSFVATYDFDDQGLYSIDVQTYLYNDDKAAAVKKGQDLYQKFFDAFSKKYGQPEEIAEKSYSWTIKSKNGVEGEIQLIDNSDLDDYGSVNIIVEAVE